ncbi:hypothetical protein PMAYCL1PPCAC_13113, partial [Pristionchus mayeri]
SGAHMLAGYRMREMRERRETANQCTNQFSGHSGNRRHRSNADCNIDGCFPDVEDSASRQATMLSTLIVLAIITGICLEECQSVRIALFMALILPVSCATTLTFFGRGRAAEICFIIGATGVLVFMAVAWSLFLTTFPQFRLPAQAVSLVFVLVYLAICMRNDGKMHILLTFFVAVPTIAVAILLPSILIAGRSAFALPTLTLLAYKAAAAACCKAGRTHWTKKLFPPLLVISGALVLLGACLSVAPMAFDLKEWGVVAFTAGFVLAILSGIIFNALLVIQRWNNEIPAICQGMKKTPTAIFTSISIILLMGAVFLYMVQSQGMPMLLCITLFICLYFGLMCAHGPVRGKIPLFIYILLMSFFLAPISNSLARSQWEGGFPFHPCYRTRIYGERFFDRIDGEDTLMLGILQSLTIFVYVMMSALLCSDNRAEEAAILSMEREEKLRVPSSVTTELTGTYDSLATK